MEAQARVLEAYQVSSKLILELQKLSLKSWRLSKFKFQKKFIALHFCGPTNKMEK